MATKRDGKQCTRDAKVGDYCTQHSKNKPLPPSAAVWWWEKYGLPKPAAEIGAKYLKRIRTRLEKGVKPNDTKAGFIYIYYFEHERGFNLWKVGKTNKTVDERLKKWKSDHHKDNKICLHKSYALPNGGTDLVERTIHDYFKHWNVHRYPQDDGSFYNVYSMTGEPFSATKGEPERDYSNKTHKHVEWFHGNVEEIKKVLQKLTEYVK